MLHGSGAPGSSATGIHPGYISGKQYNVVENNTTTSAIPAIDTIYFVPFRVLAPLTFVSAAIRSTVGGAGSSCKLGIYANSTVSGRPLGAPLFADNTGQATTGTGNITFTMSGTLTPGLYWYGIKTTGTPPTVVAISSNALVGYLVPNGSNLQFFNFSFADTYSNNMPTMIEGATFTGSGSAVPALALNT